MPGSTGSRLGVLIAAIAKTIDNFNYVTSALSTVALFNPLYHCVALVRDASLDMLGDGDLVHLAVLVVWALLTWRLAIWRLRGRLID